MKRRHFLRSAVVVSAIPICGVTDSAPSPTGFQLGKTLAAQKTIDRLCPLQFRVRSDN